MGKVVRYGFRSSTERRTLADSNIKMKKKKRKKDLEELRSNILKVDKCWMKKNKPLKAKTTLIKTLNDIADQREKNDNVTQGVVKVKKGCKKKICNRILPEPIVGIYKNGAKGKEVRKSNFILNPINQARLKEDIFKLLKGDSSKRELAESSYEKINTHKLSEAKANHLVKKDVAKELSYEDRSKMSHKTTPLTEYRELLSIMCSENFEKNTFLNEIFPDPLIEVKTTLKTIYADTSRQRCQTFENLQSNTGFTDLVDTIYPESNNSDNLKRSKFPSCSASGSSTDFVLRQKILKTYKRRVKNHTNDTEEKSSKPMKHTVKRPLLSSEGDSQKYDSLKENCNNCLKLPSPTETNFLFSVDGKSYRKPSTNDFEGSEFSLDLRKRIFPGIREVSDRSSEIDLDDDPVLLLRSGKSTNVDQQAPFTLFSDEKRAAGRIGSRNERTSRTSDNSLQSTQDDLLSLKVNDSASCKIEDFEINNREDLLARYLRDVAMNKSKGIKEDHYNLNYSSSDTLRDSLDVKKSENRELSRDQGQFKYAGKNSKHVPAILRRNNSNDNRVRQPLGQNLYFPNGIMCPTTSKMQFNSRCMNVPSISPRMSDIDTKELGSRNLKVRHGESRSFNFGFNFVHEQRPSKIFNDSQMIQGSSNQTCIGRTRKIVTFTKRRSNLRSPPQSCSKFHQIFEIEKTRTDGMQHSQNQKCQGNNFGPTVSPEFLKQRKSKNDRGTHFITFKNIVKQDKPRVIKDLKPEQLEENRKCHAYNYPASRDAQFDDRSSEKMYVLAINEPSGSHEMQRPRQFQRPSQQEFISIPIKNNSQNQFVIQREASDLTIRDGVNNLQLMTFNGQEKLIDQNRGVIFQDAVQPLKYLAIADNQGIQRVPVYIQQNGRAIVATNINQIAKPVFIPKQSIVINSNYPTANYTQLKHLEHPSAAPASQLGESVQISQANGNHPVFVSDGKSIQYAYDLSGMQPCQFKQIYGLNGLYPVESTALAQNL